MQAMREKNYEAALDAFSRSYGAVRSPNSQLMVGRMLAELRRDVEAWDALVQAERAAAEAAAKDKKYEQTAGAARAELEELRPRVGFVVVKGVFRGDRVVVEGREREQDDWADPLAVTPGNVRVVRVSASGERITRETSVAAGATVDLDLTPPPPPPPAPPPPKTPNTTRTLAYVAGGIGAAGIVTFAAFGTLNHLTWNEVRDSCDGQTCPRRVEDDADAGQTYQTIANVGLVVGVVGAAAGVTLWVLADRQERREQRVERAEVGLGPASVSVRGRF
jgi:hypothetical protein